MNTPDTVAGLFLTTDPARLARRHLGVVLFSLVMAMFAAAAMRVELLSAPLDTMQPRGFGALLSLHGTLMVFFVALPLLGGVLGNALPLGLLPGRAEVAFPRLARFSWWLLLAGSLSVTWGFVLGGTDAGWSFDTSFDGRFLRDGITPAALGVLAAAVASGFLAMNTLAGLRTAAGSPLATALRLSARLILCACPVLLLCMLAVLADTLLGFAPFDPATGGEPALFPILFSLFSTPALNAILLAGFGVSAHILAERVHPRPGDAARLRGVLTLLAFTAPLAWNRPLLDLPALGALSVAAQVATAGFQLAAVAGVLLCVNLLRRGLDRLDTAALCALGFLVTLATTLGSGLLLILPATRGILANTTFHAAHLHATLGGAVGLAFLGGLHQAWPAITGRRFSETTGRVAASLIFAAIHLTRWPLVWMGWAGMSHRANSYLPGFMVPQVTVTAGFLVLLLGLVLVAANLAFGRRAASARA